MKDLLLPQPGPAPSASNQRAVSHHRRPHRAWPLILALPRRAVGGTPTSQTNAQAGPDAGLDLQVAAVVGRTLPTGQNSGLLPPVFRLTWDHSRSFQLISGTLVPGLLPVTSPSFHC